MNPLLRDIPPSLIRALNGQKRPDSIDLGMGEPTLLPDPLPLREALALLETNGCRYSDNAGLAPLRQRIAELHEARGDLRSLCIPSQVGITVGSQEALSIAVTALLDPTKGEALIIEPAFTLYHKLCQLAGAPTKRVHLPLETGYTPDAQAVLAAVSDRTSLLFLGSPNNPTGRIWPEAELSALCAGLSERSKARGEPIYLVSDEVYREIYFTEKPPPSPARYYEHTVVVQSLSKSCALTGLRIGWFVAPKEAAAAMLKVHQFLVSCAGTFGQQVALRILAEPERLAAHRGYYLEQRNILVAALDQAGLAYVPPEGSFYCLVSIPGPIAQDSVALALSLLKEENVVAIPGAAFAAEGTLRLSMTASASAMQEGVRRIAAFFARRTAG